MIENILMDEATLIANIAIQTRVGKDPDALERYRYALEHEREDVPPVVLFEDSKKQYWIGDGHHRCGAQLALNPDVPIRATVYPGTKLDAIRHALKANAKHGLPRTTEDLRAGLTLAETYDLVDPANKKAVAEILGCGVRQAERLTRPARSSAKRERNRQILDLHAQGKSERDIADALKNVSQTTVNRVIQKRHVSQTNQDDSSSHQEHRDGEETPHRHETQTNNSDGRPPVAAYESHEPETEDNSVELDPWDALTSALTAFLQSSPEHPTLPQAETTQDLIAEVQNYLQAPVVDEILGRLTTGQPYTAADAKAAFSNLDLKLLATGEMTEASAEHFLAYTLGA